MAQGPKAKKKSAPRRRADPERLAIEAGLQLAADLGWRHVTMADIAAEAKLGLADLYAVFPSKGHLLAGFTRRIDTVVLAGDFSDLIGHPPRDRLFDVMMRRIDALEPYKEGVANILRDMAGDPLCALCAGKGVVRSMRWMLEAAEISTAGLKGRIRAKGLAAIWASTLRVWLRDDSPDKSRTMAALDRNLTRVDNLLARRRGRGGETRPTEEAA